MSDLETVKGYLADLGLAITSEDAAEEIVVVDDEAQGIKHLVIDCEAPILIIEQFILELRQSDAEVYKRLLQINRGLVHGAFVLDESGERLLFRDTLQLANLDLNELQGSINALSLAMAEHADELIRLAAA